MHRSCCDDTLPDVIMNIFMLFSARVTRVGGAATSGCGGGKIADESACRMLLDERHSQLEWIDIRAR